MASAETVLLTLFSSMATVGLVGNLLVCFIIQRNRPVKRPINYLFLNLAVSDTIVLVFLTSKYVLIHTYEHPTGTTGDFLCKFLTGGSLAWTGAISSVCTMICISFERFYIVLKPCHYLKVFKVSNIKVALVFSWVLAVIFNIPLFVFGIFDENKKHCTEAWPSAGFSKFYVLLWLAVVAVIPAIIVFVVYSQIIYILWIKKKNTAAIITRTAIHKARRKVTKVVYIISLIYCISWFPPLIINVIAVFAPNRHLGDVTYEAAVFLIVINSSVNPLVYTFQSARFRQHLKHLFCRRKAKNSVCPQAGETNPAAWVPPLSNNRCNGGQVKELQIASQDLLFLWLTGP